MALNWNEIKDRAVRFSKEWENTTSEDAEAKSFLDAFFDVFGIPRRKIGTFEHKVKKLGEGDGYIDMIWKGHILVEMKSRGKDLDRAFRQAKDYTHGLKQEELPKYILVSDFHHFRLYDTEEMSTYEFTLPELYKNVGLFGYLIGVSKKVYKEQDPANIKAAELMGKLHDRLEEIGENTKLCLQKVLAVVDSGLLSDFIAMNIRESLFPLGTIKGEVSKDDLLESIFIKFCIWK